MKVIQRRYARPADALGAYKPFRYPWAFDMWKKQQQVHWMPEEVPLGEDMKDWAVNLNDKERNLLTQIFRFFTQSDIEVADNYMEKYGRVFKPTEVKMMLSSFANMETIHIAAYALLLETIGMPESEFGAFMEYEAMRDKHDFMGRFGVETKATSPAPWPCSAASPRGCSCSPRSRC
jgi:ribonucleoside-diphosphate reductase beta chain